MFIPEYLKRWKLPSSYFGAEWPNHYVFLGRHRDSDELSESNFETALERLKKLPEFIAPSDDEETVSRFVVRESHWAVGWVEWIAIHESDEVALKDADEMLASLEDYPVLDEEDWSRREEESANRIWQDCYRVSERVEYIREHRSQFDFHGFADLLAVARGRYFNGYASELIH